MNNGDITNDCVLDKLLKLLHSLRIISLWENTSTDFVKHHEKVCNLAVLETKSDKARVSCVLKDLGEKYSNGELGLDIGCGGGALSTLVAEKGAQLFVMDISYGAVDYTIKQGGKYNVEGIQGTAEKIPFKNNVFDFCLSTEVIEHTVLYLDTIKEMHRVLKKNGLLVITIPNAYGFQGLLIDFAFPLVKGIIYKLLGKRPPLPAHGHLHMFSRKSFFKILEGLDFIVEDITPITFPIAEFPQNRYIPKYIFKTMQIIMSFLGKVYPTLLVGCFSFKLRKSVSFDLVV